MPNVMEEKLGQMDVALKGFIDRHDQRSKEAAARLLQVEQALVAHNPGTPLSIGAEKSLGALVIDSDGFQELKRGSRTTGQIEVQTFARKQTNVITGPWSAAPDFRPFMQPPAMPRLVLRDVLPSFQTVSNMVEYPREVSHGAPPDYQPGGEGGSKVQTDFTYQLIQNPVVTIAHWVAVSRQVLDDSDALRQYINSRMLYLLEAKVETELLFGSGAAGTISGLCTLASPFSGTGTDLIEATAQAIEQLSGIGWAADFIVTSLPDWWKARQLRSTINTYIVGDPLSPLPPTLWGLTVSLSPSMPAGRFLVGVSREAAIANRMTATLELSREHSDFFVRNLLALLCEERLCLCVYRPEAFIYGAIAGATGS